MDGFIGKFFITTCPKGNMPLKGRVEQHIGMEYFLLQMFNESPEKGMMTYRIAEFGDMKEWMFFDLDDQMQTVYSLLFIKKIKKDRT